jgi:hypothetical protein
MLVCVCVFAGTEPVPIFVRTVMNLTITQAHAGLFERPSQNSSMLLGFMRHEKLFRFSTNIHAVEELLDRLKKVGGVAEMPASKFWDTHRAACRERAFALLRCGSESTPSTGSDRDGDEGLRHDRLFNEIGELGWVSVLTFVIHAILPWPFLSSFPIGYA